MFHFKRHASVTAVCLLLLAVSLPAAAATRDDLLKSAVRIRYERTEGGALITGHGTAFGVDLSIYGNYSRRLMLSAAHNVLDGRGQPYSTLKIEINEGSRTYWSKCKVVASDESIDLCLVESGDDLPMLAKLGDADLQAGSPVVLAGSPRGVPVALFDGEVTRRFESGSIRSAARIPFDHGDSGGPFFCAKTMKVAGVAVAGVPKNGDLDHNIGLFVPLVGIESFLQAHIPAARNSGPLVAARSVPHPTQRAVAESKAPPAPVASAEAEPAKAEPVALTPAPAPAPAPIVKLPVVEKPVVAQVAVRVPTPAPTPVEEKPVLAANKTATVAAAKIPTPERSMPKKVDDAPMFVPAEKKVAVQAPAPLPPAAPKIEAPAPIAPIAERARVEPVKPSKVVYTVQVGDNLTKIAKQYNVAVTEIVSANGIDNPNHIKIGMKVTIPVQ